MLIIVLMKNSQFRVNHIEGFWTFRRIQVLVGLAEARFTGIQRVRGLFFAKTSE
jgi:hypothetical protein